MIPIIVVRLVYLNSTYRSIDRTYNDVNATITTIFHANLSIVIMAVPFLKPFMDSLQTGILASDLRRLAPIQTSGLGWSSARPFRSLKQGSSAGKVRTPSTGKLEGAPPGNSAFASVGSNLQGHGRDASVDSEEMVGIKQTRTVGVQLDPL